MNATETIFALALASNCRPQHHFQAAEQRIASWGKVEFSPIYLIPCRDGVGEDYWNAACLLRSRLALDEIQQALKQLELDSGRVRPSHQITLDVDLIAWGEQLNQMQFNPKKLPLALDVKIPLWDLWQHQILAYEKSSFPRVTA